MKKKIDLFWYWFIFVVAFVLCFFAVNDKKINAYHLNEYGNVVSDNVLNYNNQVITNCGGTTANLTQYGITINGNITGSNCVYYFGLNEDIEVGTYYVSFYDFVNGSINDVFIDFHTDTSYVTGLYYREGTRTFKVPITIISIGVNGGATYTNFSFKLMVSKGTERPSYYEPFGVWYSESNAEDKYLGRLPSFTSSLTYEDGGTGATLSINDLNSYIDNSFGYLYFDRVWTYLDRLAIDGYYDARLTINFNENLNINTSYIINSTKQNYGSGVWFYQNNDLMLDVRNFYDNDEYCGGASQYSCNVELNKYVNVGSGANSFSYLNKIVVWSATTDERTLTFGYNNIGYNSGYDNGYSVGYKDGKNVADNLIYNDGYTNGYNVGYDKGINYASNGGNTLVGLVGAVFTSPVNMLHTIFDFEFLGINLTSFLFSLISLFIVIWLIRKFL